MFGEASVDELLCCVDTELGDALEQLGVPVQYIVVSPGQAEPVKDELGGIKYLNTTADRSIIPLQGGVTYNPSEELRGRMGMKGSYDVLLTVMSTAFEKPINKEDDKFIINGIEYAIEDYTPGAGVQNYTGILVIGLKAN